MSKIEKDSFIFPQLLYLFFDYISPNFLIFFFLKQVCKSSNSKDLAIRCLQD